MPIEVTAADAKGTTGATGQAAAGTAEPAKGAAGAGGGQGAEQKAAESKASAKAGILGDAGTAGAGQAGESKAKEPDKAPAKEPAKGEQKAEAAKEGEKGEPAKPFELKLPEGVQLDDSLKAFQAKANEVGLTPEQAQAILDTHLAAEEGRVKAAMLAFEQRQEDQIKELRNDKEVGGTRWDQSREDARRALMQFGGEAIFKAFEKYPGLGNDPAFVRLFVKIGRELAEDTVAKGKPGSGKPQTTKERISGFYTDLPRK